MTMSSITDVFNLSPKKWNLSKLIKPSRSNINGANLLNARSLNKDLIKMQYFLGWLCVLLMGSKHLEIVLWLVQMDWEKS